MPALVHKFKVFILKDIERNILIYFIIEVSCNCFDSCGTCDRREPTRNKKKPRENRQLEFFPTRYYYPLCCSSFLLMRLFSFLGNKGNMVFVNKATFITSSSECESKYKKILEQTIIFYNL